MPPHRTWTQNWFAVGIDFLIVIVGVFNGIQVSNWNGARAAKAREELLLIDLHAEAERTIRREPASI